LAASYPDISEVYKTACLPLNFEGESGSPMHSCWLSLFEQSSHSLLYVVTETLASGRRWHLTEKTFKPICLRMPFVIVGTHGSLEYLRSYGFKTFSDIWDESYDQEVDDLKRLEKIANLLKSLDSLSQQEKQRLFVAAQDIVQHNYEHFYNGAFENILWAELTGMLDNLSQDIKQ
jgi:hypothetical protein